MTLKGLFAITAVALSIASCKKEPEHTEIAVTGISISPESIVLKVGEQAAVTASITPGNATNRNITFSSSKESMVTISKDGIIEAISAGKAVVTATSEDGGFKAHCNVTVAEDKKPETPTVPEKDIAETGAATHISCRNAEIAGKANPAEGASGDLSFGIQYSTSSQFGDATTIKARSHDSEYNFGINTDVLEPETTYYFRAFVSLNGNMSYGQVKSFKTLSLSSMIQTQDATEVGPSSAVMNAVLDLEDCKFDGLEYGFEVSTAGKDAYIVNAGNHSQKKFSAKNASLSIGTVYSFAAFVKLDGRMYKATPKSFTTSSVTASITATSSDVKYHSATISGKCEINLDGTFEKSAMVYFSSTANTTETLKESGEKKMTSLGSDGSYSAELVTLAPGTHYNYCAVLTLNGKEYFSEVKDLNTANVPEGAVDLGLSVVWANCNLGASAAEEYGSRFAWGETVTKSMYWPQTYSLYRGEMLDAGYELEAILKYNLHPGSGDVDGKGVLDAEDDAAHVILGKSWRMPTSKELDELIANCSCEWTTLNDVYGYKMTSKLPGFTDKWIFLPAAGMHSGTVGFTGKLGYYWSSSLYDNKEDSLSASLLYFSNSESPKHAVHPRYYGFSVRPVSD